MLARAPRGSITAIDYRCDAGPADLADYAPAYYAAFLLDPDGNNVEAVCLAAK